MTGNLKISRGGRYPQGSCNEVDRLKFGVVGMLRPGDQLCLFCDKRGERGTLGAVQLSLGNTPPPYSDITSRIFAPSFGR